MKSIQIWNELSPNWNKIRRAAAAQRNEEDFSRNERGFEYLNDLSLFQPVIVKFFEEEKKALFAMIENEAEERLNQGYYPNQVKLGRWWILLLDNVKTIYISSGPMEVIEDTLMDSDWHTSHEDGSSWQRDRHEVRVQEFPYRWIDPKFSNFTYSGENNE